MMYQGASLKTFIDKALAFADHFSSAMTSADTPLSYDGIFDLFTAHHVDNPAWSDHVHMVAEEEIKENINSLCKRKSPGLSLLSPVLAKLLIEELIILLHSVISTNVNQIPLCWKKALLQPIHKKGAKTDVIKYCGIAMQSVIGKIIDKIITRRLKQGILPLIPDCQQGFVPYRSTTTNLLTKTSCIMDALSEECTVGVVYFDIAKVFDKLNQRMLIKKLIKTGIPINFVKLIQNFVSKRVLAFDGEKHNVPISSSSGVPQGSHIGPILFVAFCIDVTDYITFSRILQYADDTKLYLKIKVESDEWKLQMDIYNLSKWCEDRGLQLNNEKTVHVTYRRPINDSNKNEYIVNAKKVAKCELYKDLGMLFDQHLRFKQQTANIVSRAIVIIGFLSRKHTKLKNINIIRTLYVTLLLPILEYCSCVWMSEAVGEMQLIEQVNGPTCPARSKK